MWFLCVLTVFFVSIYRVFCVHSPCLLCVLTVLFVCIHRVCYVYSPCYMCVFTVFVMCIHRVCCVHCHDQDENRSPPLNDGKGYKRRKRCTRRRYKCNRMTRTQVQIPFRTRGRTPLSCFPSTRRCYKCNNMTPTQEQFPLPITRQYSIHGQVRRLHWQHWRARPCCRRSR